MRDGRSDPFKSRSQRPRPSAHVRRRFLSVPRLGGLEGRFSYRCPRSRRRCRWGRRRRIPRVVRFDALSRLLDSGGTTRRHAASAGGLRRAGRPCRRGRRTAPGQRRRCRRCSDLDGERSRGRRLDRGGESRRNRQLSDHGVDSLRRRAVSADPGEPRRRGGVGRGGSHGSRR